MRLARNIFTQNAYRESGEQLVILRKKDRDGDRSLIYSRTVFENAQVLALARELNHLLWTDDAPKVSAEVAKAVRENPELDILGTNMQCVAHSVICAAIFLRRGEAVTTRHGSALIVYPEQRPSDEAHFVVKHWWITTSAGLCDLSLNLQGFSAHKPVIFENRNVADQQWKIAFTHDFKRALKQARECHSAKQYGVFYQTDTKKSVVLSGLEEDLQKPFPAASTRGVTLRFIDIVEHSERVLTGEKKSLLNVPQLDAWGLLAAGD